MDKNIITIPMEEYKELLIINGRYRELKERHSSGITIEQMIESDREIKILPCKTNERDGIDDIIEKSMLRT